MDKFNWRKPFIRASDKDPGYVIYRNDSAQIVIVKFRNGWEAPYDLQGNPIYIHHEEHKLVNNKEV